MIAQLNTILTCTFRLPIPNLNIYETADKLREVRVVIRTCRGKYVSWNYFARPSSLRTEQIGERATHTHMYLVFCQIQVSIINIKYRRHKLRHMKTFFLFYELKRIENQLSERFLNITEELLRCCLRVRNCSQQLRDFAAVFFERTTYTHIV